MPFKKIPGLPGKLYIPEQDPDAPKKHDCPDCFSCQICSDSRCRICRGQHKERPRRQRQSMELRNAQSYGYPE
ncbi:MAG: hypothetical protein KGY61_01380 [Desulfobacterales bacterium]|nr:hypothetical protein [Desulfobacterales bacterium]